MTPATPSRADVPVEYPGSVLDLVEAGFRSRPDAIAVVDPDGSLTYGQLDTLTRRVAAGLRERGAGNSATVAVHARTSRWAIVAMLGVLRAGAGYVPVDATFPAERQRRMLELSGAALVLVGPDVAPEPGPWTAIDVRQLVDSTPPAGHTWRGPTAYTLFTSGTTGNAKAVVVPSAALAYSTAARLAYYPGPVDGFLLCSSISFDSSVAGIYWTLATGGRLIIPSDRPANLVPVLKAAEAHRASHLLMVPSLYALLLRAASPAQLADLTTVIVAGETCPPQLVARHAAVVPGAVLYNEYGPTECTVWSTVHRCGPDDARSPAVPIGEPIPGTTVRLLTPGGDEPVPAGATGELCVSGPGVASGAALYRTGDLASVAADGLLRFHSRLDDQLKLGGVRIELAEIEQAIAAHPVVRAAGVGRVHADRGGTVLVAFVVPESSTVDGPAVDDSTMDGNAVDGSTMDGRAVDGSTMDIGGLRAFLLARLPAVAVPRTYFAVETLPAQPNGKLDRRALDHLAAGRS
jgi:amino acid adenylation domain-containing protein